MRAEASLEDVARIGPGRTMHPIEKHPEPAAKVRTQGVKIEDSLHQGGVIGKRVEDQDFRFAHVRLSLAVDIDVRGVEP